MKKEKFEKVGDVSEMSDPADGLGKASVS